MTLRSPDRDLSSPERSKRRISLSPHVPIVNTIGKRPRVETASDHESTKDSPLRRTPHLPPISTQPSPYHPRTRSTVTSPSSSTSASASEGTALIDEDHHRRPSRPLDNVGTRSSRRTTPDVPPPTSSTVTAAPTRRSSISQQSGIGQSTGWTRPNESSSTSSSSSSHRARRNGQSPPPSHTLSTGQPIVHPPLKTQAAFVGKLFSMLEDEEIRKTGLIHWSAAGQTFTCPNPTEFAKIVLPRFFKHNNWQSFVRQLNMYSFNKVNDLYATSSDPMAWEFRHPLFRQSESHLLASIKRKTTRPTQTDGHSALSPTDEMDPSRPVAGWMTESTTTSPLPLLIPPPPISTVNRSEVFGYNLKTGETITSRPYESRSKPFPMENHVDRLTSIRATSVSSGSGNGIGIAQPQAPGPGPRTKRHRSETEGGGPFVSAPTSRTPTPRKHLSLAPPPQILGPSTAYPESSQYPQPSLPSPSPIMALTSQVAFLEERIARLSETLSVERVENVRSHMDTLSYVASIALWLPDAPAKDISALQDSLNRQTAELRHKYDALIAVDALAHLAGRNEHDASYGSHPQSLPIPQLPRFPPISPGPHTHPYHTQTYPPTNRPLTSPRTAYPSDHPHQHHGTYSHIPLLPQSSRPGTIIHPPPPGPPKSDRAIFDQPPFSRSPLIRRPETGPVGGYSRPGSSGNTIIGDRYSRGVLDSRGASPVEGVKEEKWDIGERSGKGNLRDLLN